MAQFFKSPALNGRLVPVFNANAGLSTTGLTLSLAKTAAASGETVLMVDCQDGALMRDSGIIYNITMSDVLYEGADMTDALYVTSNEHFTALAAGSASLEEVLGTLAALSLRYDWVIVGTEAGCTPSHVRLAGAADISLMAYDTNKDNFMRAYWMIDAVRRRHPRFDPLLLSMGERSEAVETALMLTETVGEHLGAPPPYGGHVGDESFSPRLFERMRFDPVHSQVA